MSKDLSFRSLHRISGGIVLLMLFTLIGFGGYVWIYYGDLLVGQVKVDEAPTILTHLENEKFDHAKKLLETRQALPYPPSSLPNPFFLPPLAPPPAPPPPPAPGH